MKRYGGGYSKANKSGNKSPWKSWSPNKKKKKIAKLKSNNDYGIAETIQTEKIQEEEEMPRIDLFSKNREQKESVKAKSKKRSKHKFSLKRKLTLVDSSI